MRVQLLYHPLLCILFCVTHKKSQLIKADGYEIKDDVLNDTIQHRRNRSVQTKP
jgi:hypothetical protein